MKAHLALALFGAALITCTVNAPPLECTNNSHCEMGVCVQGRCVMSDAGADADLDVADEDAPPSFPNDPAPELNRAGAYPCGAEGPQLEFSMPSGDQVVRVDDDTPYEAFSGLVSNTSRRGGWYVRDARRELFGEIVRDDDAFEVFVPITCEDLNVVKIHWSNATCTAVFVFNITVSDCRDEDLQATLLWNQRGGNLDLHLVRPGGRLNDLDDDCDSDSCTSVDTPDWGPNGDRGNPSKDIDDIGGGPETIRLDDPEDGVFTLLVERDTGPTGSVDPTDAMLIVTVRGTTTGVQILNMANRAVWEAATVTFPAGTVNVVNGVDDCTDDWGALGCQLELP